MSVTPSAHPQSAQSASSPRSLLRRAAVAAAWLSLAVAIGCAAAELLGGPGYRAGWWSLRAGIKTVQWAAWTGVGAFTVALIGIGLAWKAAARGALVASAHALVLSALAVGPPLYLWTTLDRFPRIHDVSTDPANPPAFAAVMPLRKGAPNSTDPNPATAARQREGYPDIAPALLDVPPAQAFQRAERAAKAMGWEIVAVAPEDLRIEATDTTLLFGFKDDVVIRVASNGAGSRVDVRSESRVGGFDFGVNAKRVRDFLKQLDAAKTAA